MVTWTHATRGHSSTGDWFQEIGTSEVALGSPSYPVPSPGHRFQPASHGVEPLLVSRSFVAPHEGESMMLVGWVAPPPSTPRELPKGRGRELEVTLRVPAPQGPPGATEPRDRGGLNNPESFRSEISSGCRKGDPRRQVPTRASASLAGEKLDHGGGGSYPTVPLQVAVAPEARDQTLTMSVRGQ